MNCPWRKPMVRLGLIGLGTVLLFAGTLDHPFQFDDGHSITQNPHLRPPVDWWRLLTDPGVFSRNPGSGMHRPLVVASYVLNYHWGGLDPRGWHALNIALHALCTVLVGAVAWRISRSVPALTVAAVLFAVHPLAAEPVNYISSRSESMALTFLLAGLWLYLSSTPSRWPWVAVPFLFTLALACKVTGLLLLPVVLLYEWGQGNLGRHWRRWAPLAAVALADLVLQRQLWQEALLEAPVRAFVPQILTQTKALVYYLKLLTTPVGFTVEHAFHSALSPAQSAVVAAAALVLSILWLLRPRVTPGAERRLFLLLWPLLSLVPTFVVPLNVLVSEHRLYPALAGVAILAGVYSTGWSLPAPRRSGLLAVLVLAALSLARNQVWASERTLWEEAVRRTDGVRPHVRLGMYFRQQGELSRAEDHLRRALQIDPSHAPALNNLGNVLQQQGDLSAARQAYEEALRILPAYPEALINLGALAASQGRVQEALGLYRQATRIAPDHFEAWNNMATVYLRLGEPVQAEQALRQGLARSPGSARMLFNLGGALEAQGRAPEAIEALQRSVAMEPAYARAWLHLGNLLRQEGSTHAAAAAYQRFLQHWQGDAGIAERVRRQLTRLDSGMAR